MPATRRPRRSGTAPSFFTYTCLGETASGYQPAAGAVLGPPKKTYIHAAAPKPKPAIAKKNPSRKNRGIHRANTVHVYDGQPQTKGGIPGAKPKAKKATKKATKKAAPKKKKPAGKKKAAAKKQAPVKKKPVKKKPAAVKKGAAAAAAAPARKKKTIKRSGTVTRADDISVIAKDTLDAYSKGEWEVHRAGSDPFEAQLSQIDISKNMDKFFHVQLVQCADMFCVCSRWGRTGTKGQEQVAGPFKGAGAEAQALKAFEQKFKEKTGVGFAQRESYTAAAGKYSFNHVDYGRVQYGDVMWQYWVDNGVDGKADGWYDYFADASANVDATWLEWQNNPRMMVRCISSGHWTYRLDFRTMTQANTSTGTQRKLRRTVDGKAV